MPQCMMGKTDHNFDIFLKNPCKHNKHFQVKDTSKFKLLFLQA